ncbi:MAG TPA: hypothetical protein VLC72_00430, partial [Nitrosopumilaceae archaeon]|nr:hypothetical protein [Nitrosopumilaceae archaeon]
MDLQSIVPLVIYDNQCYLCTKFAKVVNLLARGNLSLVGHYSSLGEKLRNEILDSSALEMFWFIDGKTAYGGRAALGPLFNAILTSKEVKGNTISLEESCDAECKTAKAVFIRSASLLTNSKKIKLG